VIRNTPEEQGEARKDTFKLVNLSIDESKSTLGIFLVQYHSKPNPLLKVK